MEALRKEIEEAALTRGRDLKRVELRVSSILSSKLKSYPVILYGSFADGTFTAHSDLDISMYFSGHCSDRAENLVQHIQRKGYQIENRSFKSRLVPFTIDGVTVDVMVESSDHNTHATTTNLIRRISQDYTPFVDVVRFLKTFAAVYVDRNPNGIEVVQDIVDGRYHTKTDKPTIPGSCLYTFSTAIALDLVTLDGKVNPSFDPNIGYVQAIKKVCQFIGGGAFEINSRPHPYFASVFNSRVKFTCTDEMKENFKKLFRALLAHLTTGSIPSKMHATAIPDDRDAAVVDLLEITRELEEQRDAMIKEQEKKAKEEKERKFQEERQKRIEEAEKRYSQNSYYSDSDDDGGFIGTNGKRYNDYTDWYESDDFDEDWHD